jgi:hypothetical protein
MGVGLPFYEHRASVEYLWLTIFGSEGPLTK